MSSGNTAQSPNSASDVNRLREWCDKQEILECIHRYCRGVDRFDRELILSAYHPDAVDDHGLFVGGPEEFADWAIGYHLQFQEATHHIVTNHSCELDGDTAHTETYWLFSGINKEGPTTLHFGRYIDRFERVDGRWAIAARACVIEWHAALNSLAMPAEALAAYAAVGVASRDARDKSYERPLQVRTTAESSR